MKDILTITIPIIGMLVISYLLLKHYLDKSLAEQNKDIISLKNKEFLPLKMQAYERAILFLERIDPNNLIMRIYKNGMTSKALHAELIKTIRDEYTHNMSQQIYISVKSWGELKKAKEETVQCINMAMNSIAENGTTVDLSSKIFELISKKGETPSEIALKKIKIDFQRSFN